MRGLLILLVIDKMFGEREWLSQDDGVPFVPIVSIGFNPRHCVMVTCDQSYLNTHRLLNI